MSSAAVARSCFVFTTTGCKYCEKAKRILTEHNLAFEALDVEFFSKRYKAAAEATAVSTVPLVFFGAHFVGGGDDVEALAVAKTLVSTYNARLSEPSDLPFYLAALTDDERDAARAGQAKRDAESDIYGNSMRDFQMRVTFDTTNAAEKKHIHCSYLEIQQALRSSANSATAAAAVPMQDAGWLCWKRKNVVLGRDLLQGVQSFLEQKAGVIPAPAALTRLVPAVTAALVFKLQLLYNSDNSVLTRAEQPAEEAAAGILPDGLYRWRVDSDIDLNGSKLMNGHRLLCSLQPALAGAASEPLQIVAAGAVDPVNPPIPPADVIGRALWRAQDAMQAKFRNSAGLVDYKAIRDAGGDNGKASSAAAAAVAAASPLAPLRDLSVLLQGVDLAAMTDKEKTAFGINVYNAAVYHGFAEFGVPWGNMQKIAFFSQVGYLIGPAGRSSLPTKARNFFSLNDIENGLLRGNRKGVLDFFGKPWSDGDPRLPLAVKQVDYRIHFGLNCGANSCPPVKVFTAANLDAELDAAAKSFLQSTTTWNGKNKTLTVSQILKWYSEDFAMPTTQDVVLKYLSPEVSNAILQAVGGKTSDIKLAYAAYDWAFAATPAS